MEVLSENSEEWFICWNMRLTFQSFLQNQTKMDDDLRLLKGNAFFSKTRLRERVICSILSIVME